MHFGHTALAIIICALLSKNICYNLGAWNFKNSVFIIWYLILFSTSLMILFLLILYKVAC